MEIFSTESCWVGSRYRLDQMTREEKLHFMKLNGLSFTEATPQEIEARQRELKAVRDAATMDMKQRTSALGSYFKVPFTEALDLVSTHGLVFIIKSGG